MKRASVVAVFVVAGTLVTGSPASAEPWPSGCSWGISGLYTTYADCTRGSGEFRAVATCSGGGRAYGPWQPAGAYPGYSTANCGNRPTAATISLRR